MIELKNYSCKFFDKYILKDINLKVDAHLCILGSNGSGKSTLVKSICNLVDHEGDIYLDSKNIKDFTQKELAKELVYIPTKLEINDEFVSVEEYVLLGRYPYKKSFLDYTLEDKKIVKENLKLLNLLHLKKHSVSSLSSGEQQLIQIATALTQKSKTIIFDEPTANLDPKNTLILSSYIKKLKSTHNILVITHDLSLATSLEMDAVFVKNKTIKHYKKDIDFKELVDEYD